jgi:hypothetical protein
MNIMPLPYPVPTLNTGANVAGVHAHFAGLHADPPAQLVSFWAALIVRRMAGQNVDAECAQLLHIERQHNTKTIPATLPADMTPGQTAAAKAFRQFRESQQGKS